MLGTLQPPEPISPASKPTKARRVHCQKRNGCASRCLVCSNAGEIVSIADSGNLAPRQTVRSKVPGTAAGIK